MNKLNFGQCAFLFLSAFLSACSGSSKGDGSSCSTQAACGGNPVGTWTVTGACGDSEPVDNTTGCAGATASIRATGATGTLTVNADNTESTDFSVTTIESIDIPTSCYTSEQCTLFKTSVAGIAGVTAASCTYSASSGCSCAITIVTPASTTGTYQVSGSNITVTDTGEDPEVDSFCVSGNQLTIRNTDASGAETTITAKK